MAIITGTNGHDRSDLGGIDLIGTSGNDRIYGLDGNDYIDGGAGHDTLFGGSGDYNTIRAGDGDDAVLSDGLGGWFDGGAGLDTVIFSTATGGSYDLLAGSGQIAGRTFTLSNFEHISTGAGNDVIRGTNGRNVVTSGAGNDTIESRAGNDEIFAGAGNDTVDGGARNDVIRGEAGNDTLKGGFGNDILIGGAGYDDMWGGNDSDRFVFTSPSDSPWSNDADTIHDFRRGYDRIDLSALDANAHVAGNQAFNDILHVSSPMTSPSFDAGTIAYMGTTSGLVLLVNISDAQTNGLDAPELVIELKGLSTIGLSDVML